MSCNTLKNLHKVCLLKGRVSRVIIPKFMSKKGRVLIGLETFL